MLKLRYSKWFGGCFLEFIKIDSCEANFRLLEYSSSLISEAAKIEISFLYTLNNLSFKKWRE